MNKLKFLEERISELEEKSSTSVNDFTLSTITRSENVQEVIWEGDTVKFFDFTPTATGSVYISLNFSVETNVENEVSFQIWIGEKVVGVLNKTLSLGVNELLFFGGCKVLLGEESLVKIKVLSCGSTAVNILNKYSLTILGAGVETLKNKVHLSGDRIGNNILLTLSDGKYIYSYFSDVGEFPSSKSDFKIFGEGAYAVSVLDTSGGIVPRICRKTDSGKVYLSSGLNISTEELVAENVSDIAIGETDLGVAIFYIKNNLIYFKEFIDGVVAFEKMLVSNSKNKFSELSVAGRKEGLAVIVKTFDEFNYIFFQVGDEFDFGGENINLKIITTIEEV